MDKKSTLIVNNGRCKKCNSINHFHLFDRMFFCKSCGTRNRRKRIDSRIWSINDN